MGQILLFALVFVGGIAVALQPSVNARLAARTGVLESSCISFTVCALALLCLSAAAGKGTLRGAAAAPWWELTGGLMGAFFVTMTIFAVPRLGTASVMAAAIAAQLTTSLLLDAFAPFGFRQVPLDAPRLLGALLLLSGAALMFRR
ncbi:MAG TPA: DMT family transporter [Verrucomicrobiae bacterium]|nr:DMT family transporter [Verrucomicrobiae bacterium]